MLHLEVFGSQLDVAHQLCPVLDDSLNQLPASFDLVLKWVNQNLQITIATAVKVYLLGFYYENIDFSSFRLFDLFDETFRYYVDFF